MSKHVVPLRWTGGAAREVAFDPPPWIVGQTPPTMLHRTSRVRRMLEPWGLPDLRVDRLSAWAMAVIELVRAVIAKRSSYLTRLALSFLRPSELRDLRSEILGVTQDPMMPTTVKDFAARLVVPT
mgnify:CR=1 FL=1